MDVDTARALAGTHLQADLPRRWAHVCAVAAKAGRVAAELDLPAEVLVSAAWLHDIGYGKAIADTGFHPLDGARYLRRLGVEETVVELVAHHSCALVEADERGLEDLLLDEFAQPGGLAADALWYCDMTTGPDGQDLAVAERLAEIRERYGPGHVVTRFVDRAAAQIHAAADRTVRRIEERERSPR